MTTCAFCGKEFDGRHTSKYCNECRHRYDEYLNDTVREGSMSSYFSHLINLEKWLKDHNKSFEDMDKRDVERYIREEMEDKHASSINTFISVVQSYAKWMITNNKSKWIKEGGLERMYMEVERWERIAGVKRPVMEELSGEGFLTIDDLKKYLSIVSFDDFCLAWILAWFGGRIGEFRHAERQGKLVMVRTEKTRGRKVKRRIGLDDFTIKIFDYTKRKGILNMTPEALWHRVQGGTSRKYNKAMGMHITTKHFRHTFSTYMDKRLINDEDIKEKFGITLDDKFTKIWQGHKVRGMDITQIYKEYPDELIIYVAEHKHYMIPLEREFKHRLEERK